MASYTQKTHEILLLRKLESDVNIIKNNVTILNEMIQSQQKVIDILANKTYKYKEEEEEDDIEPIVSSHYWSWVAGIGMVGVGVLSYFISKNSK
jgi:hypothetical protein